MTSMTSRFEYLRAAQRGLTAGLVGAALLHGSALAQAPGGRGGFGMQQEREVVAQFDRNGDERLDTTERAAARAALATPTAAGGGGRGMGGGRGFGGGGGAARQTGSAGARLTPADVQSFPESVSLYDAGTIRTIFLQFESADWEQELAAFNNTDVEVPATAIVDGKTYQDVGVHFRGASSYSSVPEGSKRSLNLSFNFVNQDQRLGGYRTLNLLNANSDPTFVRTMLYSQIANDYLAAPKVNFVRVVINGESWGVYLNVQQFNKDFVGDFFPTNDGARWNAPGNPNGRAGLEYLGEDVEAYKRVYEIKTKDDAERWADLIELTRVLNQTPADQLEAALAPILDIDGALRFLALDVALVNTDGYWTRASDYNLYQGPDGRFHVIPHDMNEALGIAEGGPGGGGGSQLDPLVGLNDPSKPLRSKLLAVPALRERYLGYVRDIAQKWMDWNTTGPLIQQYQSVIAQDVATDTRKLYSTEAFQTGVTGLQSFFEQRRAFLLR